MVILNRPRFKNAMMVGWTLLLNRDDESVAVVKENGERLFKALTEEDSPALTKGMKLLRGAHERVSEEWSWKSKANISLLP